jgi:flagellar hook-associated protein 2
LEFDQAEKTNIVSTLGALQAKIFGLKSLTASLMRSATFEKGIVSLSDEGFLSATANGRVSAGSYDLQVLSLARNHQIASQGFDDESAAIFGTGTILVGVGDRSAKTITIDSSNNSLIGIKQAINDADAGVRATIIDDGSESNPFRLVISGQGTGVKNSVNITPSLTGGETINVSTAGFDMPETVDVESTSDAVLSLGASSSYSGNVNKTYTFTVQGTGAQIVGTDNITIDWTDGTNSGSIVVTQADSEVELVGTGADGMYLSLSVGQLTDGDTFQVQTFAPLLQEASDAKVAVGSNGGTGSPITITSETNTLTDVIAGITLTLRKETEAGEFITLNTDHDTAGVKQKVNDWITAYNNVMSFIDKQNSYNEVTKETGLLMGDVIIQTMQNSIRRVMGDRIEGLTSNYNQLATIGIRTGSDGKISIKDSAAFDKALENNLDEVIDLFANSGSTSTNFLEFISATADTEIGENYDVEITQAATQGIFKATTITDLATTPFTLTSANNRLKFSINNIVSDEIILTEKEYNSTAELIDELQEKIDADAKIGSRGLTAEWISTSATTGYVQLTSSSYGEGSTVGIETSISSSAFSILGLAGGVGKEGVNVEGTINGEEAEGKGQMLTGMKDNETTDGLKIKVTYEAAQLGSGVEGKISLSKGVASALNGLLDSLSKSGTGLISSRIKSYEAQVKNIKERVAEFDERLTLRRERLKQQFIRMEQVLGMMNATSQFLTTQLAQVQVNWNATRNR